MTDIRKDFQGFLLKKFGDKLSTMSDDQRFCMEIGFNGGFQAGRAHDVDGLIAEIEAIDNGIGMPLVSRSHVLSVIRKHFGKE
jgi:hypothetical protein